MDGWVPGLLLMMSEGGQRYDEVLGGFAAMRWKRNQLGTSGNFLSLA